MGTGAPLRRMETVRCRRERCGLRLRRRLHRPAASIQRRSVSRATSIELARDAGLSVVEKDLDLHDAYNADEIFLTSTSLCIVAAKSFCGATIGDGRVPGPITKKLTEAYIDLVNFDFVEQYLQHLK